MGKGKKAKPTAEQITKIFKPATKAEPAAKLMEGDQTPPTPAEKTWSSIAQQPKAATAKAVTPPPQATAVKTITPPPQATKAAWSSAAAHPEKANKTEPMSIPSSTKVAPKNTVSIKEPIEQPASQKSIEEATAIKLTGEALKYDQLLDKAQKAKEIAITEGVKTNVTVYQERIEIRVESDKYNNFAKKAFCPHLEWRDIRNAQDKAQPTLCISHASKRTGEDGSLILDTCGFFVATNKDGTKHLHIEHCNQAMEYLFFTATEGMLFVYEDNSFEISDYMRADGYWHDAQDLIGKIPPHLHDAPHFE